MRKEGEARAEEPVEQQAVEEVADRGAPVREEAHEVRKDDLAEELRVRNKKRKKRTSRRCAPLKKSSL